MFLLFTTILITYSVYGAYPRTDQSNSMGWTPVWQLTDEFANGFNSGKWYNYNPGWLGRQPGLFAPKNVEVKNGKLYMKSGIDWNMKQEYKNKGYHTFTTSAVTAKTSLLYGYVEIKAKVGGSRVSSAFWLSNNQKWGGGSWTEIDVFEAAGRVGTTYNNYHILHSNTHVFSLKGTNFNNVPSKCVCNVKKAGDCSDPGYWSTDSIGSFSDGYHIYGLHWTRNWFKIYVDGKLIRTTTNRCLHQELFLKFDRETFPNWFGLPAVKDIPDAPFIIEYVRTWKQTGSGGGSITLENKDGITQWWYAVRVSGLKNGVTIKSLKMKDKDMTSWQSGVYKTSYWAWHGRGPYNAPFDFKVKLSTGQEITRYDVIKNYNVGTKGTMTYNAAFTTEEESTNGELTGVEIAVIVMVAVFVIVAIGVGTYCIFKRKKQKKEVVTLDKNEDVQLPEIDDNEEGYDMSPIDTTPATETLVEDEQDPEIEIDVDIDIDGVQET